MATPEKLNKHKRFLGIGLLPKLKDVAKKINEVIDYLNDNPIPDEPAYRVYTAILEMNGASDPTAIVLQNTLGFTPTYTRDGVGEYLVGSAAGFTANKTALFLTGSQSSSFDPIAAWNSSSQLYIYGDTDNGLEGATFEIRVYN